MWAKGLGAIVLVGLAAGCGGNSAVSGRPAADSSAPPALRSAGIPVPDGQGLGVVPAAAAPPAPFSLPAMPAPARIPPGPAPGFAGCPPITVNPLGCPVPLPPQPITPPSGRAHIALCFAPTGWAPLVPTRSAVVMVCGTGFVPGELVTITVTGRLGSVFTQASALADGSVRGTLPPTACRVLPLYAIARGNKGSLSNAVPIGQIGCQP